jgi:hypothetical protein
MMTIDSNLLASVLGGAKTGAGGLVLGADSCPVHTAANVAKARKFLTKTHQTYGELTAGYKNDPINQYNYVQGNRCDPDSD